MRLASLLMAVVALALAGCGEDPDGKPGAPPRDTGTSADDPTDGGEDGTLFVDQRRSDPAGGRYIEGAVPYVEVVDSGGETVLEQSFPRAPERARLVRTTLAAGSYRITSWVRPWAGVGQLDSATDRCSAPLEVPSSGAVTAIVARTSGRECQIEIDRTSFDDIVGEDVEGASAIVERRGFDMRVVERDGEALAITLDLRFDRLNVAVEDGRVSGLRGIG